MRGASIVVILRRRRDLEPHELRRRGRAGRSRRRDRRRDGGRRGQAPREPLAALPARDDGRRQPACEPPSAIHWSCSLTSCAVWNRSSGSFARHVFTTRSSAGGAIGAIAEIGAGSSLRIAEISEAWLFPVNAFRPVAIS